MPTTPVPTTMEVAPMAKQPAETFSDFEHRIREHMEKAYQRVFGSSPGSPNFCAPYMEPPVDVYQTDKEVVVLMEIAGIPEEEIELQVEGHSMLIRGERRPLPGHPRREYSQMEIAHGAFQREILLPSSVDAESMRADYKNGILEIVLPKTTPAHGRQLRIVVS
jgi:HSP20 family protein